MSDAEYDLRAKAERLEYLKARQVSILLKIEDLESAVSSGLSLETYEPKDLSMETQQPQDSAFAKAFYEAEKRVKASGGSANELSEFRGTDQMGQSFPAREPSAPTSAAGGSSTTTTTTTVSSPKSPGVSHFKKTGKRTEAELKLDHALLNACYFGNTNGVLKLIRQGADIEYMEERDGWCAIHYAARWGDVKMLLALLNAGADVNLRTNGKETALHKATRWDQKDVAVLLLKRGALAHFKNGDGKKASDMTADKDLSYICDNFEQWCEEEKQRIKKEQADAIIEGRKRAAIEAQEAIERAAEDKHRQEVRERRLNGLRGPGSSSKRETSSPSPTRR